MKSSEYRIVSCYFQIYSPEYQIKWCFRRLRRYISVKLINRQINERKKQIKELIFEIKRMPPSQVPM